MPWKLPDSEEARLALAKGYPYAAPPHSYLLSDGAACALCEADCIGRVPVLAHGSNRSPQQLARKFAKFSGVASEIQVTYAWLYDYDIVYSAHITRYGAIASTLQAAPGCCVRVALTWLDAPQLERMHETEGNYRFGYLKGARVSVEAGPSPGPDDLAMYLSEHGCLAYRSRPLGMAAVTAEGRRYPSRSQSETLDLVRRCVAPDLSLDAFILSSIQDAELRRARIEALRSQAVPTQVPDFEQL